MNHSAQGVKNLSHISSRLRLVGAWLVGGACAWEILALGSAGRLPTLSSLAHRARRHPAGAAVIVAGLVWLTHHLLLEEPDD